MVQAGTILLECSFDLNCFIKLFLDVALFTIIWTVDDVEDFFLKEKTKTFKLKNKFLWLVEWSMYWNVGQKCL